MKTRQHKALWDIYRCALGLISRGSFSPLFLGRPSLWSCIMYSRWRRPLEGDCLRISTDLGDTLFLGIHLGPFRDPRLNYTFGKVIHFTCEKEVISTKTRKTHIQNKHGRYLADTKYPRLSDTRGAPPLYLYNEVQRWLPMIVVYLFLVESRTLRLPKTMDILHQPLIRNTVLVV